MVECQFEHLVVKFLFASSEFNDQKMDYIKLYEAKPS